MGLMGVHLLLGLITAGMSAAGGTEVNCGDSTPAFLCGTPVGDIISKAPGITNSVAVINLVNPFYILDLIEDVLSLFSFNHYAILAQDGLASIPLWVLRMVGAAAGLNLMYVAITKASTSFQR